MMKKTLLAAATASALVVSGGALAAFADAPKGEGAGASAQLKITGTLTNTNPNWMWQIPADAQAAVKDVTLKKITGVVNGANTEFSITTTPMSILEGYMKTPAPTGGAGLTPVINVGGTDMMKDCSAQAGCSIALSAKTGGKDVGVLTLDAITSWAYAHHLLWNVEVLSEFNENNTTEALAVLKKQADFDGSYPDPKRGGAVPADRLEKDLQDPRLYEIVSQSRVVTVRSAKLRVPTEAVPATWAATLPITISLK
ncbi:hypothetical protein [Vibrio metoecus]|uniref:F4 family fimbrial subunit n=1 Tax=Vibrio metoecus TaxID=1481663 RepID=UPI0001B99A3F|nr:hypothetical protein [Vibrio metoecus]EEX66647.1 hypothetical protein VCJ_001056 [Vibrio metoecus]